MAGAAGEAWMAAERFVFSQVWARASVGHSYFYGHSTEKKDIFLLCGHSHDSTRPRDFMSACLSLNWLEGKAGHEVNEFAYCVRLAFWHDKLTLGLYVN